MISVQEKLLEILRYFKDQTKFDLIAYDDEDNTVMLHPVRVANFKTGDLAHKWAIFLSEFLNEAYAYAEHTKNSDIDPLNMDEDELADLDSNPEIFFRTFSLEVIDKNFKSSHIVGINNPEWIRQNMGGIEEYLRLRNENGLLRNLDFACGKYQIGPFEVGEIMSILDEIDLGLAMLDDQFGIQLGIPENAVVHNADGTISLRIEPTLFEQLMVLTGLRDHANKILRGASDEVEATTPTGAQAAPSSRHLH